MRRLGRVGAVVDENIARWSGRLRRLATTPRIPGGFLQRLDPEARDALLAAGTHRRFPTRAVVFAEGDAGDFVVVITEGRAKVVVTSAAGDEVVLALRGPGDVVGEMGVLDDEPSPRSAALVAIEPLACRIVRTAEFLRFLDRHPEAKVDLLRVLSARLREAERRRVEFGAYDTTQRLARLLLDLAIAHGEPTDGGIGLGVKLSQDDLAKLVGVSRESVTRALTALRRKGLVSTARRAVTIRDATRLRAYAD